MTLAKFSKRGSTDNGSLEVPGGQIEQVATRLRDTEAELHAVRAVLTRVLRRPSLAVADKVTFLILSRLARLGAVIGQRRARKFAASAAKRDPSRYAHQAEVVGPERAVSPAMSKPEAGPAVDEGFVSYRKLPQIDPKVRLIAFYLPQFHPFPENDEWWGKGFTEWTNVGKAVPNFAGHYQPHCPIHLGYYDLRVPSVMEEQAKLAREYGIHGFSYYFYWFGGKTLMEGPLEQMLANPRVDIPFCFTWANEDWTRRWDGREEQILIAQKYSREDSLAFLRHMAKYFADPRYIRVDGCPMLLIYRADQIPNIHETVELWRAEARRLGFAGLHLVGVQTIHNEDPTKYGLDAAAEFPPHRAAKAPMTASYLLANPEFAGNLFDYGAVAAEMEERPDPPFKLYRGVMLSWDNTARRMRAGTIYAGFSLSRYAAWLTRVCRRAMAKPEAERFVFVNAWNEWAEGTHLEPDRKHGYGYLQATYDVLASLDDPDVEKDDRKTASAL